MLAIEVSHTSLQYDLSGKASLYAEAGIVEYWLVKDQSRHFTGTLGDSHQDRVIKHSGTNRLLLR